MLQGERPFPYIQNVGTVFHRAKPDKQWIQDGETYKRTTISWQDASQGKAITGGQ